MLEVFFLGVAVALLFADAVVDRSVVRMLMEELRKKKGETNPSSK